MQDWDGVVMLVLRFADLMMLLIWRERNEALERTVTAPGVVVLFVAVAWRLPWILGERLHSARSVEVLLMVC